MWERVWPLFPMASLGQDRFQPSELQFSRFLALDYSICQGGELFFVPVFSELVAGPTKKTTAFAVTTWDG